MYVYTTISVLLPSSSFFVFLEDTIRVFSRDDMQSGADVNSSLSNSSICGAKSSKHVKEKCNKQEACNYYANVIEKTKQTFFGNINTNKSQMH